MKKVATYWPLGAAVVWIGWSYISTRSAPDVTQAMLIAVGAVVVWGLVMRFIIKPSPAKPERPLSEMSPLGKKNYLEYQEFLTGQAIKGAITGPLWAAAAFAMIVGVIILAIGIVHFLISLWGETVGPFM